VRNEVGVDEVDDPAYRAVFLDRDGVLNVPFVKDGKPYPPKGPGDLVIYEDALDALRALKAAGYLLLVVTNQPDVARGTKTRDEVEAIDQALTVALPIDGFYVCYHDGDDCDCRKPKPGLLLRASAEHAVSLPDSFMIGDRWRDIDAGYAARVKTILIDRGYAERGPAHSPDAVVSSLAEAARWILHNS